MVNNQLSTKIITIVLGSIIGIPLLLFIFGYIVPVWRVSHQNSKIIEETLSVQDDGLDPADIRLCLRDSVKLNTEFPTLLPLGFVYTQPISNNERLPVIVTLYEGYEKLNPNTILVRYSSYTYFMIPVGEGSYTCNDDS